MSGFQVTASELKRKADDLKQLNSKFEKEVEKLESTEAALNSKWEGEARKEFHQAFDRDKAQMKEFKSAIDGYAEVLKRIAEEYERAERANTEVARTRSYK